MDSPSRDQGPRLDPEAADDVLPHLGWRDIEDGFFGDRGCDPGALREFAFELPRPPARIAEQHENLARGITRDVSEHIERTRKTQTRLDLADIFASLETLLRTKQHPARLGLNGATPVDLPIRVAPPFDREGRTQHRSRDVGRAI